MSSVQWSSHFVPCSDASSSCEVNSGSFFGVAGVCNVSSLLCICPDGYTGLDDIVSFNDCHISTTFRNICHISTLVITIIATLVTVIGLIRLSLTWGVLFWEEEISPVMSVDHTDANEADRSELVIRNTASHQATATMWKASQPHSPPSVQNPPSISSSGHTSRTISRSLQKPLSMSPKDGEKQRTRKMDSPVPPLAIKELPSTVLSDVRNASTDERSSNDSPKVSGRKSEVVAVTIKRKKSRAPRVSMKPMQSPRTNVRSATFFQDLLLARRRRNTFLLMLAFVFHSAFAVIAVALFLSWFQLESRNGLLQWSLGSSLGLFQMSVWILVLSWCSSLPSMKTYSKMFPRFATHPLVRFPAISQWITLLCLVTSTVFCLIFFFILPFSVDSDSLSETIVPVGLTLLAVMLFVLMVFQSTVFLLLLRMFNSYNASQRSEPAMMASGPSGKAFIHARTTVQIILFSGWLLISSMIILLLVAAWCSQGRSNMYFFLSAIYWLTSIVALGCTYIIVFRISTKGSKKPVFNGGGEPFSSKKNVSQQPPSQAVEGRNTLVNRAIKSELKSNESSHVQLS